MLSTLCRCLAAGVLTGTSRALAATLLPALLSVLAHVAPEGRRSHIGVLKVFKLSRLERRVLRETGRYINSVTNGCQIKLVAHGRLKIA